MSVQLPPSPSFHYRPGYVAGVIRRQTFLFSPSSLPSLLKTAHSPPPHHVVKLDDVSPFLRPGLPPPSRSCCSSSRSRHPRRPRSSLRGPRPRPPLKEDVLDDAEPWRSDAAGEATARPGQLLVLLDDAFEGHLRRDAVDLAHTVRAVVVVVVVVLARHRFVLSGFLLRCGLCSIESVELVWFGLVWFRGTGRWKKGGGGGEGASRGGGTKRRIRG